ncbi:MAG: hypothetical protein V2I97_11505 [Desulfococcaceae bacterium]|jgi:hypothetical protein|nr:hypothetical protein [Desulfococcaceae bacterium]
MFRLATSISTSGTSLRVIIRLRPSDLLRIFGPPEPGDHYQVSGCYTFTDQHGEVFTVYESRSTTLYWHDTGENFPTPEEFWNSNELEEMGIGGRTDASEFIKWFVRQIGECQILFNFDRKSV